MRPETREHKDTFKRLIQVRAATLDHYQKAQQLAVERREIMRGLLGEGFSQADIARELGVSRQAVQKMLTIGVPTKVAKAASTVNRRRRSA